MGTDFDFLQGAVVFRVAMVSALSHGALNAFIGVVHHGISSFKELQS